MGHADKNRNTLSFLAQFEGPCPRCGFTLHRSTSNNCPECGFILTVTLKKPFRCTSWHLFLFGLIASLGVCVDQVGLFLAARVYQGSPILWWLVLPELFFFVLIAAGVALWWKARKWANELSNNSKLFIGAAGLVLPIVWFNILFWLFVLAF